MPSDHVDFKYKFPENYNPIYINGAHGGVGPRGEIVLNFFLERPPVPLVSVHNVNEKGILGAEVRTEPEDYPITVIRYISTGVIMNVETAKKIKSWLEKQIDNYGKLEEARKHLGV